MFTLHSPAAIANSRLIALDECGGTFKWNDYRDKGRCRHNTMRLAIANMPLQGACNDRAISVAVPLGRWHPYKHIYSLRGVRDGRHAYATDPAKVIGSLMTNRPTNLYGKVPTQTSIARSSILTALPHPAVSSLEAYQTPAR